MTDLNIDKQQQEPIIKGVPPIKIRRNEFGLYTHIDYVFKADGNIDWRKMIKPEFLFARKGVTETDINKLEDKDLLIRLDGIKELARIRGYHSVVHSTVCNFPGFVQDIATIRWIPNFETDNRAITFSSCADAHSGNTSGFGQQYLSAIAENRSFVRAVRNFLGVLILGEDEIGPEVPPPDNKGKTGPHDILEGIINKNTTFDRWKNRMIKDEVAGAEDWSSVRDIDASLIFSLIDKTNVIVEEKKKREAAEVKKS